MVGVHAVFASQSLPDDRSVDRYCWRLRSASQSHNAEFRSANVLVSPSASYDNWRSANSEVDVAVVLFVAGSALPTRLNEKGGNRVKKMNIDEHDTLKHAAGSAN